MCGQSQSLMLRRRLQRLVPNTRLEIDVLICLTRFSLVRAWIQKGAGGERGWEKGHFASFYPTRSLLRVTRWISGTLRSTICCGWHLGDVLSTHSESAPWLWRGLENSLSLCCRIWWLICSYRTAIASLELNQHRFYCLEEDGFLSYLIPDVAPAEIYSLCFLQ